MKVVIAGSRDFNDYALLVRVCDHMLSLQKNIEIVSGTARGADQLGERYAQEKGLPVRRFPADWDRYGKAAGYVRNLDMANYADAVIAFWDGESRGTYHMTQLAQQLGLKLKVVYYKEKANGNLNN